MNRRQGTRSCSGAMVKMFLFQFSCIGLTCKASSENNPTTLKMSAALFAVSPGRSWSMKMPLIMFSIHDAGSPTNRTQIFKLITKCPHLPCYYNQQCFRPLSKTGAVWRALCVCGGADSRWLLLSKHQPVVSATAANADIVCTEHSQQQSWHLIAHKHCFKVSHRCGEHPDFILYYKILITNCDCRTQRNQTRTRRKSEYSTDRAPCRRWWKDIKGHLKA